MVSNRNLAILASVGLLVAFLFGRFSAPEKVKIEKEIVQVDKKTDDKKTDTDIQIDRDRHRETTTIEVKKPDGTVEKTTKIVEDSDTKRKTDTKTEDKSSESSSSTTHESKEITARGSRVQVSLLSGASIKLSSGPAFGPFVYGAHVSKQVLGPISFGVWGLTDGTFGLSAGFSF